MTVWTERGAPPATVFLEGPLRVKKMSNNFYYVGGGFVRGLSPRKLASNFYDLAGSDYPGLYYIGKRLDNFVEVRPR